MLVHVPKSVQQLQREQTHALKMQLALSQGYRYFRGIKTLLLLFVSSAECAMNRAQVWNLFFPQYIKST